MDLNDELMYLCPFCGAWVLEKDLPIGLKRSDEEWQSICLAHNEWCAWANSKGAIGWLEALEENSPSLGRSTNP
jgi:hypothetical protein